MMDCCIKNIDECGFKDNACICSVIVSEDLCIYSKKIYFFKLSLKIFFKIHHSIVSFMKWATFDLTLFWFYQSSSEGSDFVAIYVKRETLILKKNCLRNLVENNMDVLYLHSLFYLLHPPPLYESKQDAKDAVSDILHILHRPGDVKYE